MSALGLRLGPVTFRPPGERRRRERDRTAPMRFFPDRPVAPLFSVVAGGSSARPARRPAGPLVSVATHVAVILLALLVAPLTGVTVLPDVPQHVEYILAWAASPPPVPPPPGPAAEPEIEPAPAPEPSVEAPPQGGAAPDEPLSSRAAPRSLLAGAPLFAAAGVRPESGLVPGRPPSAGGVPGGVGRGGVAGGVVGGLPRAPVAPPAPPPEPEPVRVGGPIPTPALVHRVDPVYPVAAQTARQQGIVILDATVDPHGVVGELTVLRSAGKMLDAAAMAAVQQWRYAPLLLHGTPTPFRLTVTVTFTIQT